MRETGDSRTDERIVISRPRPRRAGRSSPSLLRTSLCMEPFRHREQIVRPADSQMEPQSLTVLLSSLLCCAAIIRMAHH
jgi:hypothetical protein